MLWTVWPRKQSRTARISGTNTFNKARRRRIRSAKRSTNCSMDLILSFPFIVYVSLNIRLKWAFISETRERELLWHDEDMIGLSRSGWASVPAMDRHVIFKFIEAQIR